MLARGVAAIVMGIVVVLGGVSEAGAVDAPDSLVGLNATYDVTATIRWARRKLTVTSTALVTNHGDTAVDALTFNAAPAKIGKMKLGAVLVGTDAAAAVIDDQSIIVTLPVPLEAGQQVPVTISYVSWWGTKGANKQFLFARVEGIATAYRWIPWLSKAYAFTTPTFGEPFVTKAADDVRVSITSDRPLVIAATGHRTGTDGFTQTFEAHNVRDFNFSASPHYVTHTDNWGDITITYYTVELPLDRLQRWTVAALERFSQRVGPYPYTDLAVSEVPTGPSMESPGMVWITQSAVARGTLKYLMVHEMAHQWFYGVVGNNEATEPFADEAMAEFLTRDLIGHRLSHCAQDVLDKHLYDYSASCYYEVVYVQGDTYLEQYRQRVGDPAFWDGMRRYYDDYRFKIGGTRELFDTLDAAAGDAGGGHETRFPSLYPGTGG
jgi:hypothetical protein